MSEYPLIAGHGLIGDLQTVALVATDGTLDWFCSPQFDSPSIFASITTSALYRPRWGPVWGRGARDKSLYSSRLHASKLGPV
jgi:GH15 family glucan-1,4-alpha-glucosidase